MQPQETEYRVEPGLTKYIVVSPVRNEAQFIELTLRSMVEQTVKPARWIIVDDGSTDESPDIVTRYAEKHPWIQLIRRQDRGSRQRGRGVVEAFYTGYETVNEEHQFVVKLDGDLSFEPSYFEALFAEFAANPRLGIAGGGVYEKPDGKTWRLHTVSDHVRGATKVYRRACFEEIGGLARSMGWDGIDEWQARRFNWIVRSYPHLQIFHHRYTGVATGPVKSRVEEGRASYFMGYHPLFLILRGIRHMFSRPYFVGGIAMIAGFFTARLRGHEQVRDPDLISFIRSTQLRQLADLLRGKPIHQ
jgi:biofilm PGA synthesis N-glycosyltransferase PgaC